MVDILLEQGSQDTGRDTLVMDASDGSSTDENDQIDLEDKTSGIATYVQAGTTRWYCICIKWNNSRCCLINRYK